MLASEEFASPDSADFSHIGYEILHCLAQVAGGVILMCRIPLFGQLRQMGTPRRDQPAQHFASGWSELGMRRRIHARDSDESSPAQLFEGSLRPLRRNALAARELEWRYGRLALDPNQKPGCQSAQTLSS